jgi:hypothetical protein
MFVVDLLANGGDLAVIMEERNLYDKPIQARIYQFISIWNAY